MPWGLTRFHESRQLHFLTFSCPVPQVRAPILGANLGGTLPQFPGAGPLFLVARNTPWLPHPSRFSMGGQRSAMSHPQPDSVGHDMARNSAHLFKMCERMGQPRLKFPREKGGPALLPTSTAPLVIPPFAIKAELSTLHKEELLMLRRHSPFSY